MSALNLPKPKQVFAGEDELRKTVNGTSSTPNGDDGTIEEGVRVKVDEVDEGEYQPPRPSDRFKVGLIYPPREIRLIVDKTASAVNKSPHPKLLEDKIRDHQKSDPKFAFLNLEDPYHQYYRFMKEKVLEDAEDVAKGILPEVKAAAEVVEQEVTGGAYEPKSWEFRVDLPGVTAMDLDILRLTALFHARRGRAFLSSLSVREGRNYQFDFLRPTHSLYGYYNRMVESYQKVMQPPPGQIETLVKEASDPDARWKSLEEARNRAEWEKGRRKREDAKQKERDEEADAFAAIDWQDFVVVETIEFTQNDMELNLPPPSSMEQLKNRSMGEKRMASMIMEESGAGPTGGDVTAPEGGAAEEEMEMEEEEEEEELRLQRIKAEKEQARAKEVQRAAMESRGMKIKKDYVPKGVTRGSVATAKCPNCGQSIPENELSEHIRIELLDPKWKEQKRILDSRRAQHQQLNQGADITASLRNLASARTDLFGDEEDEETRKAREEEERRLRKEREKIIWDGHTATASKTADTFQSTFTLDEQIKRMHARMGLTEPANTSNAPVIGPAAGLPPKPGMAVGEAMPGPQTVPPALAAGAGTPGGGTAYDGATISAAPTGPTTKEYYETVPSKSSSGPSIHPSRLASVPSGSLPPKPSAATSTSSPAQIIGQSRPAPTDPESEPSDRPVFKRPKVEKLAFGTYSEVDWLSLHPDPIAISVQLPSFPDRPDYKLDGSVILVPDLPVNTLFSTVRERIKRVLDADLPISRMQLSYEGKVMSNASSLASVNLDEGDSLVLVLKKK